jgi:prepilin peptidase CpaA
MSGGRAWERSPTAAGKDAMPAVATLLLLLVLALAVREDVLNHRIPNTVVLAGIGVALLLAVIERGIGGLVSVGAGAAAGAAVLVPLYAKGGTGAGDVKLMAATGAFLGPWDAVLAALFALVIGAAQGLLIIVGKFRSASRPALTSPSNSARSGASRTLDDACNQKFPYALAIAAGTTALLWYRGALGALLVSLGLG